MVERKSKIQRGNVGRPIKHNLDFRQVIELAKIQCTMKEIAAVMGCSIDILERNYADVIAEGREGGKASLRRAQWKKAVDDGNPSLLIWLGRFYLGQREEVTLNAGSETEVRKLLENWEVSAKKKTTFDKFATRRTLPKADEMQLAA